MTGASAGSSTAPVANAGKSVAGHTRSCLAPAMIDVHIRPASGGRSADHPRLLEEAAEGTSITDDLEGLTRLIERDPEALILAEAGGPLVGSVIAGYDGWRCSLYRLAVLPLPPQAGDLDGAARRGRATFPGRGRPRGDAMVLEANERAQRAWAAAGYHRGTTGAAG